MWHKFEPLAFFTTLFFRCCHSNRCIRFGCAEFGFGSIFIISAVYCIRPYTIRLTIWHETASQCTLFILLICMSFNISVYDGICWNIQHELEWIAKSSFSDLSARSHRFIFSRRLLNFVSFHFICINSFGGRFRCCCCCIPLISIPFFWAIHFNYGKHLLCNDSTIIVVKSDTFFSENFVVIEICLEMKEKRNETIWRSLTCN